MTPSFFNKKFSKAKNEQVFQELEELKTEVKSLMKENSDLRDTIRNVTFNDNGDLFTINRKSDRFFGNITVTDAIQLLRNLEHGNTKINLAWEDIGYQGKLQ